MEIKTVKIGGVRLRIVKSHQGSYQFAGDKDARQKTKDMLRCKGLDPRAASYV